MHSGIDTLDKTIQETNQWIKEIADRLGTPQRLLAHRALRAVLHALRDRVGPDNAAQLGAQLPSLIRGIYYEGYKPMLSPTRERSRGAFLEHVHLQGVQPLDIVELERAVKVVLSVLAERIDFETLLKISSLFPDEFADLFPERPLEPGAPVRARRAESARLGVENNGGTQRPSRSTRSTKAATGIEAVDQSLQQLMQWVHAVDARMNVQNPRLAMSSLQATLQGIREQLNAEQAALLGSALPCALLGAYYEGWHPTMPNPVGKRWEFLQRIEEIAFRDQDVTVERAVKAAMEVIAKKVPAAVLSEIVPMLPEDLVTLWPDEPVPYVDLRKSKAAPHPGPLPAESGERESKNVRRARHRAPGVTSRRAH